MADIFSKEKRSEIMSRIRSKNTKPELLVFSYLQKEKIYFKKHYNSVLGKPDIALPRKKTCIFIEGDFWHGYKFDSWKEKLPNEFWRQKIQSNIERDKKTKSFLRKNGWRVLRVWEHQLKPRNRELTLSRIAAFLRA